MKIAIPVKTDKENPAVAPLFGKAKWFAFVENDKVTIEKNHEEGGHAVIEWLIKSGVDTLIVQEMGATPYEVIKAYGKIQLYHAGYERITLNEVLEKFRQGGLTLLDEEEMQKVIARHESKHSHGGHHHHHGGEGHRYRQKG
jgi:predicted Fe-Mo cluster-binding NifX family protein